jgi:hypothetical protein
LIFKELSIATTVARQRQEALLMCLVRRFLSNVAKIRQKIGLNKIVFSGKLGEKGLLYATPFFCCDTCDTMGERIGRIGRIRMDFFWIKCSDSKKKIKKNPFVSAQSAQSVLPLYRHSIKYCFA